MESFRRQQMRLFRFLLILLALSFVFVSCGADDEEDGANGGNGNGGNSSENGGDSGEGGNNGGDNGNQQGEICGNGIVEESEICDSGTKDCTSIDYGYTGGQATCKSDCSGWDTANCQGTPAIDDGEGGEGGNNGGNGDGGNGNGGFDKNSQGIWVDPKPFPGTEIHLVWENPMTYTALGAEPSHADSVTYCENLVLAGADDWRLPTIDELRTLVRGISTIAYGGKCPTTELCSTQETCNEDKDNTQGFGNSCLGCEALNTEKYDPAISYLNLDEDCQLTKTQLDKNECYIVKAMHGDPCDGTWSSTKNTTTNIIGSMMNAFWYLNFKSGIIHSSSDTVQIANWVRCVREGTAADVTEEEEEEATTNPEDWECKADADCQTGEWCSSHKCVTGIYVSANGLEWQTGTVNETLNKWEPQVVRVEGWDAAKAYCENLNYAGHDDWRLPNLTELKSIVKGCNKTNECPVTAENPAYPGNYSSVCKTCSSGNYLQPEVGEQIDFPYWTSTTDDPSKNYRIWAINFINGEVFYSYASANHYARCVRGSMN